MDNIVCIVAGGLFVILIILFITWNKWITKSPPVTSPIDNVVKQTSRGLMEGSIAMGILCTAIWGFTEVIPKASLMELIIFGVVMAFVLVMIFCKTK